MSTKDFTEDEALTLALSHWRRKREPRPCEHAECPNLAVEKGYCDTHAAHYHCENCDRRLEDFYGQPGDGMCRKCD